MADTGNQCTWFSLTWVCTFEGQWHKPPFSMEGCNTIGLLFQFMIVEIEPLHIMTVVQYRTLNVVELTPGVC